MVSHFVLFICTLISRHNKNNNSCLVIFNCFCYFTDFLLNWILSSFLPSGLSVYFNFLFSRVTCFSPGPDGIGDYRPRSNYFPWYIGAGALSPEATGDLSYLCRAAPHAPPPTPRQNYVGEVGWGWQYNQLLNSGTLLSNMQIKVELKCTMCI